MQNDPRLLSVADELKKQQKIYADIEWDCGHDDPRLTGLAKEIEYYKDLLSKGITIEPNF